MSDHAVVPLVTRHHVVEVLVYPAQVVEVLMGAPGLPGTGGVSTQYVDDHIEAHRLDPEPHPAYDDMADLVLVFENGLI